MLELTALPCGEDEVQAFIVSTKGYDIHDDVIAYEFEFDMSIMLHVKEMRLLEWFMGRGREYAMNKNQEINDLSWELAQGFENE